MQGRGRLDLRHDKCAGLVEQLSFRKLRSQVVEGPGDLALDAIIVYQINLRAGLACAFARIDAQSIQQAVNVHTRRSGP